MMTLAVTSALVAFRNNLSPTLAISTTGQWIFTKVCLRKELAANISGLDVMHAGDQRGRCKLKVQ